MSLLNNYTFRARSPTNQLQTGVVQAINIESARKMLIENKLMPITLNQAKGISEYLPFFNKISLKSKTLFARQLATMIQAGLSLNQAMRLLIRQSKKGRMQQVLESVQSDIQDGLSFSTALERFPDVFDNIFINVIRSGEATGKLEVVLQQLAETLEKDVTIRGKIKGALMYPIFVLTAMVGVAIVMLTQVIPQLKDVFTSSGKELPWTTSSLLAFSDFVTHQGYLLVPIFVVIGLGVRYFLKTEPGQELWSRVIFKIPLAGQITTESTMARFGRLLGMLLGSGVPLLEALRLITDSFTNRVYKRASLEIAAEVERGVPMSVPIEKNPVFPLIVGQMVAVGEQTGKMDEVMARLASYYDQEVETKVSSMATLIEPFTIIILGIGVAYLVIAILLPIYQISANAGS